MTTMDKISRMMSFLKYISYVIPHCNLHLPKEADGENYRPDKVFRLYTTGKMSYRGTGLANFGKNDIDLYGIEVPTEFLDAAYSFLVSECERVIQRMVRGSKMDNAAYLVVRFNGLGFLTSDNHLPIIHLG